MGYAIMIHNEAYAVKEIMLIPRMFSGDCSLLNSALLEIAVHLACYKYNKSVNIH